MLIPVLFVLSIPLSVDALEFKDKPLTFNQIAKKCTGIESKWVEYNKIGFPQSAKNYLKVCILVTQSVGLDNMCICVQLALNANNFCQIE